MGVGENGDVIGDGGEIWLQGSKIMVMYTSYNITLLIEQIRYHLQ